MGQDFWENNDVLAISRELIGCELYTSFGDRETSGIIVETEAYRGRDDKACHAYGGRRTARTEVLYEAPGRAYIYLCYGVHHLMNFVCGREGTADAVLIRAVEPRIGREVMAERRGINTADRNISNGPGKLSEALGIHTKYSGISVTKPESPLKCYKLHNIPPFNIDTSKRIGIKYAEECKDWLWRFTMRGNKYISK